MNQPPTDAAREVTQEDREAAAKLYEWFPSLSSSREEALKTAQFIRDGGADGWNTVHSYRDHRLSTRQQPEAGREGETWASIAAWCEETFGPVTPARTAERANEEMQELLTSPDDVTEAADVLIVLSRYPGLWEAVERKMAINRARTWDVRGDGTGYHVRPDGTTGATRLAVPMGVGREEVARVRDHLRDAADLITENLDREDRRWRPTRAHYEGARNDIRRQECALEAILSHAEAGGVEVPSRCSVATEEMLLAGAQACFASLPPTVLQAVWSAMLTASPAAVAGEEA